jgi:hypothetical protein
MYTEQYEQIFNLYKFNHTPNNEVQKANTNESLE